MAVYLFKMAATIVGPTTSTAYEKVPAFRRTILHVTNASDSGVLLTVAVLVKRQTSARVVISN